MKKRLLTISLLAAMSVSLLTGCGSSYNGSYSTEAIAPSYDKAEMEYYPSESTADMSNGSGSSFSITEDAMPMDTSRKLITTVNLTCETKEFDSSLSIITDKVSKLGGYIENMSTENYTYRASRSADMVIRIPAKNLTEFLGTVEENLNVTSYNRSAEDVTLAYVDTESRIKALKVEQERLEEFLGKANTIEEILTIEERMTNVRYQLENFESVKRTYDNKIDYSTVYLDVNEVIVYTEPEPDTIGTRIKQGFKENFDDVVDNLGDTFVDLVTGLPYLVGMLLTVILVLFIPAVIVLIILYCCGIIGSKKHREAIKNKRVDKKTKNIDGHSNENAESETTNKE